MTYTKTHRIILDDGENETILKLSSEWDGLICLNHNLTGLGPELSQVAELLEYAVLEGEITEGTIFITPVGPEWSDVFDGLDSDILTEVNVKVEAVPESLTVI